MMTFQNMVNFVPYFLHSNKTRHKLYFLSYIVMKYTLQDQPRFLGKLSKEVSTNGSSFYVINTKITT